MNVFDIPRSLISSFKCRWIGWTRQSVTDNYGNKAEELKLVCRSPELLVKGTQLYTCSDVCRICTHWEMDKKWSEE